MKQNILWMLIGGAFCLPFSLYAVGQQQAYEVHYAPELFTEYATSQETAEQEEQATEWEIYEPTPEELEEELYYDSLELLACCVEAEAGNQGLEGKRYVVDVVLNRVDNEEFPDSITDVIMQENAFSVVLDGRIWTVEPTEETFTAVREELGDRTNSEVLYFTAEGYSVYGTPWKKIGDHYFSTQ